jgi:hypothetical protein
VFLIADSDEWSQPRRRSWPYAPTRLERLAEKEGVDPDLFRWLLADAIQERLCTRGRAWEALDNRLEKRAG